MSKQTVAMNNGNMAVINTDTSKTFIWNPDSIYADCTNSGYVDKVIPAGTVMGRIAANQQVTECKASATNGSQYPIGILMDDVFIQDGETRKVPVCIGGEVAEDKVILQDPDGLGTAVGGRSIRDNLQVAGIKLVPYTELTEYDNQPV